MSAWHLHPQLADDTVPVMELRLCEVRLMDDANHPWLVLVPQRTGVSEVFDLTPLDQTMLTFETTLVAEALKKMTGAAKINTGALGNIVDRVRLGYVVDYADLHFGAFRPFMIFNVADACISIGVLLLVARALLLGEKAPPAAETAAKE